ncbi:4052_t:CDS:1, partial [Racocetra persica]
MGSPTDKLPPWGKDKVASKCNRCSVDKKYCYCGSRTIICWNWEDVEYGEYK